MERMSSNRKSDRLLAEAQSYERDAKRDAVLAAKEREEGAKGFWTVARPAAGAFLLGGTMSGAGVLWDTAINVDDWFRSPGVWMVVLGVLVVLFGVATVNKHLDRQAGCEPRAQRYEARAEESTRHALRLRNEAADAAIQESRRAGLPPALAAIVANIGRDQRDLMSSADDAELWAIVSSHKNETKLLELAAAHRWDQKAMRRIRGLNEAWRVLTKGESALHAPGKVRVVPANRG